MARRGSDLSRALRRGDRVAWSTVAVLLPVWVVTPVVFPRLSWRRRLRWRGQLAVVIVQTLWITWLQQVVKPRLLAFGRANDQRREKCRRELFEELGREPTTSEMNARSLAAFEAEYGIDDPA